MGQGLSCRASDEHGLFSAVQFGDLETVEALVERDSSILCHTTVYDRHSALHIAAANGQIEVGSLLLWNVMFSVIALRLLGFWRNGFLWVFASCWESSVLFVFLGLIIWALFLGLICRLFLCCWNDL